MKTSAIGTFNNLHTYFDKDIPARAACYIGYVDGCHSQKVALPQPMQSSPN